MRFNGTSEVIDRASYPMTSQEFIEAYGSRTIELQNGSDETVGEILSRLGAETFESPRDVYDSLFSAVGHQAIGRRFYSDRDAPSVGETGPQPVSF